jgi:hypothetical protein
MEELQITKWNREIHLPTAICITGKRNTGKTYWSKFLLYLLCDEADILYIICPTIKPGDWEELTRCEHIYSEYNINIIEDIIEGQKALRDKKKEMPQIVILLDDCVFSFKKGDTHLDTLFVKGRHYNITPIVLTQKFRLLSQSIRSNGDYCFCARVINNKEKEAIYQEFNDGRNKNEFYSLLDGATTKHGMLVIDNSTTEKEMFYQDRAPEKMPLFYVEKEVAPKHMREDKKGKKEKENK